MPNAIASWLNPPLAPSPGIARSARTGRCFAQGAVSPAGPRAPQPPVPWLPWCGRSKSGGPPLHVALLRVGGRRVFARLDAAPRAGADPEEILAGSTVKLLVKDDGDRYFQIPTGRTFDLGGLVQSIRRRVGA